MFWKQLFAKKTLETLQAEAEGDNRLRRVLGPIALSSLGVGAIIGAGIFVTTGRAAAEDAGPAIMLSYVFAGLGCLFAALCYSEFASMAPVAGSAYTYAYATLGEMLAWIIGWDLILEYAMACAVVAASWTKYLNVFVEAVSGYKELVPAEWCNDPFSMPGAYLNLPAALITLIVTVILVIGIRESATTNALLVGTKVFVVLFVILAGIAFVNPANWFTISPTNRITAEQLAIPDEVKEAVTEGRMSQEEADKRLAAIAAEVNALANPAGNPTPQEKKAKAEQINQLIRALYLETARLPEEDAKNRVKEVTKQVQALYAIERRRDQLKEEGKSEAEIAAGVEEKHKEVANDLPQTAAETVFAETILKRVRENAPKTATRKWGLLSYLGVNKALASVDNSIRSPFMPYGLGGIIFGASIVFFAYIGFDAISTHSEEAVKPQRDVPIAILSSLILCTVLYIGVAAVITGMIPYPEINPDAAVADAFQQKYKATGSIWLRGAALLIATGALAGMTSVLLITFLSQARIFLAMARDRLLPPAIFGAVHSKFRTPHISTMLTGGIISVVSAFTPISKLEEMVNIGTLMAFVIVCGAVLLLRIQNPNAHRPFRTPFLSVVAPLGILVNVIMMLFLPLDTWIRLVVWLLVGMVIYLGYGMARSTLGKEMRGEVPGGVGGTAFAGAAAHKAREEAEHLGLGLPDGITKEPGSTGITTP